ncbi:MAG: hypothetical protein WAN43_13750 [Rhodomicrobium sp.]
MFELEGIVGGFRIESFHVPVRLKVHGQSDSFKLDESIGSYCLNHYGTDNGPYIEHPMLLDVILWDQERLYQRHLREAMTSAAVSGREFLHVEFHGLIPDPEDTISPFEIIKDRGYGPCYKFDEVKVWPEVFLQNTPKWAVDCHKPFR